MSKELEALENIRKTLRDDLNFPFNLTEEYKIIKQALTPMKPKVKIIYGGTCGINYEQHLCPTCEHGSILIGNYNDKVNNCFNCGQKIDWSE